MTIIKTIFGTSSLVYLAALGTLLLQVSHAQAQGINLAGCKGLWFSTSEDFRAQELEPPDGPVISDGDLLAFDLSSGGSQFCARNKDLLRVFDITTFDLGLDALDQVVIGDGQLVIAAFSTEIDSVNGPGQFTAGDLLFTTGAIVPNNALLGQFGLPRLLNLGLDAVWIEGSREAKESLLDNLTSVGVDELRRNPDLLPEILEQTNTDILFSTEGTSPEVQDSKFIDGDLLSAKDGIIVQSNAALLPGLPAGIPDRGVDYGLDAYTPARDRNRSIELFSTEIQADDGALSDGDILKPGPTVFLRNLHVLEPFGPSDTDMGLDALADELGDIASLCRPKITTISDIDVLDINQTTGLFGLTGDPVDRPFGGWIRVQGFVPDTDCPQYATHEFRVLVSVDGGPETPVLHNADLKWRRNVSPCIRSDAPYTSRDYSPMDRGWFTLTDYWRFSECPDDASLAFWNSSLNASEAAEFVTFRLELRPIRGGFPEFSDSVTIRLDNNAPEEMVLELYDVGATTPFGDQCKIDFQGGDIVMDIKGRVRDDHFSHYDLRWTGGDVHLSRGIPQTVSRSYGSRPDLSTRGTEPPTATDVMLGTLNLTDEYTAATGGAPVIECGYSAALTGVDRSHLGIFAPSINAFAPSRQGNSSSYAQSFCLKP